jgi:hypothetical protein
MSRLNLWPILAEYVACEFHFQAKLESSPTLLMYRSSPQPYGEPPSVYPLKHRIKDRRGGMYLAMITGTETVTAVYRG